MKKPTTRSPKSKRYRVPIYRVALVREKSLLREKRPQATP